MSVDLKLIKYLSDLMRIDLTPEESESLLGDINLILGYVRRVADIDVGDVEPFYLNLNVVREDEVDVVPGSFTEKILEQAPRREGNYVKVMKILDKGDDL